MYVIELISGLFCDADPRTTDSPIYPYRLNFIYPADVDVVEAITIRLPAKYPVLDLCKSPVANFDQVV